MALLSLTYRYILVTCGFISYFIIFMMRASFNVTLVAMINTTAVYDNSIYLKSGCIIEDELTNETKSNHMHGELNYSQYEQGILLGAFYWGYMILQIPGGILAHHYKPNILFGLGILIPALLNIIMPVAARTSIFLFITLLVLQGLTQGLASPSMYTLLGSWAPPNERSKMTGTIFSGCQLGNILGQVIAGFLCDSSLFGGWPSVFYLFGTLGILWYFPWYFLIYNSPAKHPTINKSEQIYIEQAIGKHVNFNSNHPWSAIFRSPPFIALLVTHVCFSWCFYSVATSLPTYMARFLGFDISQNGLLSAFPYLLGWLNIYLVVNVADYLRRKGILSVTSIRKLFTTICLMGMGIGVVSVGFVGCNSGLAILFFCFAILMSSNAQAGFFINHIDLAPQYAGTLLGVTNTFATATGIVGPFIIGIITESGHTHNNWILIFIIMAIICCLGALCFLLFGSGDIQSWAKYSSIDMTEKEPLISENPKISDQKNDCYETFV